MQVFAVFASYCGEDKIIALWAKWEDANQNVTDLRRVLEHADDYYFIRPMIVK